MFDNSVVRVLDSLRGESAHMNDTTLTGFGGPAARVSLTERQPPGPVIPSPQNPSRKGEHTMTALKTKDLAETVYRDLKQEAAEKNREPKVSENETRTIVARAFQALGRQHKDGEWTASQVLAFIEKQGESAQN